MDSWKSIGLALVLVTGAPAVGVAEIVHGIELRTAERVLGSPFRVCWATGVFAPSSPVWNQQAAAAVIGPVVVVCPRQTERVTYTPTVVSAASEGDTAVSSFSEELPPGEWVEGTDVEEETPEPSVFMDDLAPPVAPK